MDYWDYCLLANWEIGVFLKQLLVRNEKKYCFPLMSETIMAMI